MSEKNATICSDLNSLSINSMYKIAEPLELGMDM